MGETGRDLKEYIKKEIAKSGFPLETKAAAILNSKGWSVLPHLIYPTESHGAQEYRETDIQATKTSEVQRASDNLVVTHQILVIECKKQEEKPWVFFEQDSPNTDIFTLNISPLRCYGIMENFFRSHYYYGRKPCAYHFPSFVSKGEPDQILKAINQVVDATIYTLSMEIDLFEKLIIKRISFIYPIILLDGKLFSAKVQNNGDIQVNEAQYLQLKVSRALSNPEKMEFQGGNIMLSIKYFIIDIVQKDYFPEFLERFS
jgi:hypothetical protein